ncbi:hypothetical protein CDAR_621611 [Caerostris darwini]|uniref:Uncharacterized protein n=1 Tax=Caerostris darwini TaxID=1538125 RepID=A0AAV4P9A6_9ARAC|nr:hypothetical protein CDAR_621611 [Caerostris darwini]
MRLQKEEDLLSPSARALHSESLIRHRAGRCPYQCGGQKNCKDIRRPKWPSTGKEKIRKEALTAAVAASKEKKNCSLEKLQARRSLFQSHWKSFYTTSQEGD